MPVQPNDLSPSEWLVLCRNVYRMLRDDLPDDAMGILEENGFSKADADANDETLMDS